MRSGGRDAGVVCVVRTRTSCWRMLVCVFDLNKAARLYRKCSVFLVSVSSLLKTARTGSTEHKSSCRPLFSLCCVSFYLLVFLPVCRSCVAVLEKAKQRHLSAPKLVAAPRRLGRRRHSDRPACPRLAMSAAALLSALTGSLLPTRPPRVLVVGGGPC